MSGISPPSSRSVVEAEQLTKLNQLLRALIPTNPFYAAKLRNAGIQPPLSGLAEFVTKTPFTTKQELIADQANNPPFGTNLTFSLDRYTRLSQTSATTGQPLRWLDTNESWNWMVDNWIEIHRAAGVKNGDRVYFAFSFGPFIGFWLAFEAAVRLGCLCIPGGGLTSATRLRALIDNEATILCCTPTYALRLAEVAVEEGIDLARARVRTIIVAGEPGGSIPATRSRIEQAWNGARVFDHHGMTEVGPVTYEYPGRTGFLAVIESGYFAEIIDPSTGQAVNEGQTGELVLTTLGRIGSPLLRYRTGDLVKKAFIENHLCLEGGILGRADDMLIVRGVNIYPSAVEEVLRSFSEIVEYRVEIRRTASLPELVITVEPAPAVNATQLAGRIETKLNSTFLMHVPVSVAAPGSLPRFEMKAKRWVTT